MRFFLLASALAVAACGSDSDESAYPERSDDEAASSSGSASSAPGDAGSGGASSGGTGIATDGGSLPATCEGSCRESTLTLRKGAATLEFDRTQFGFDRSTSYPKLKLSAYQGGPDACPAPGDEPNHALQIAGVPAPFDGTMFEAAAGLTATLYDFEGDVIAGNSGVLKCTRIQLTPVAANLDVQAAEVFVAFDVHLEFEQGITVDGHTFSTHCASIDQR